MRPAVATLIRISNNNIIWQVNSITISSWHWNIINLQIRTSNINSDLKLSASLWSSDTVELLPASKLKFVMLSSVLEKEADGNVIKINKWFQYNKLSFKHFNSYFMNLIDYSLILKHQMIANELKVCKISNSRIIWEYYNLNTVSTSLFHDLTSSIKYEISFPAHCIGLR